MHEVSIALRDDRNRWERAGRPLLPCPECPAMRRNPETLRAHLGIAHPQTPPA